MAILKNVEIFFAKLDPKRPNSKFNSENPSWEIQIRSRDKKVAQSWKELKLNVKADEDDNGLFYKVNLKKKSKKRDGEPQQPVTLVDGQLNPLDPNTIGNGSVANVRVFQYEYEVGGQKKTASMLMAVQVTKLFEYTPKPREDEFEMTDTEVVKLADNQIIDEDDVSFDQDDNIDF